MELPSPRSPRKGEAASVPVMGVEGGGPGQLGEWGPAPSGSLWARVTRALPPTAAEMFAPGWASGGLRRTRVGEGRSPAAALCMG